MSDLLRPQPFGVLLKRILKEYETTDSIFGIHKSFFYTPQRQRAVRGGRLLR